MANLRLSATSLQDYINCHRLFQLKHLLNQPWPSVDTEPIQEKELQLMRGREFHRLVERYYLGIDETVLLNSISDDVVREWWRVYRERSPVSQTARAFLPEYMVRTVIEECVITGVFDLVVIAHDGKLLIVDWKTTASRPNKTTWSNHIQTQLYLHIATEASKSITGTLLQPDSIQLLYWFVQYPEESLLITYNADMHKANQSRLYNLIHEVYNRSLEENIVWQKTSDLNKCNYCIYRSLCNRGTKAAFSTDFTTDEQNLFEDINVE